MATFTTSRQSSVPTGIVQVLGITCTTPDCGYHESLHTNDPLEATRTARELGWRLKGAETLCPRCVGATSTEETQGSSAHRARKAVAK